MCIVFSYLRELSRLQDKSGPVFLVKYLKACSTLLIGATALRSPENKVGGQAFGAAISRTKKGLPRLIPAVHRRMIRNGSTFHVRI